MAEDYPKTIERYILQLERADSLPTPWHRLRRGPPNPVNVLDTEVRKFRTAAAMQEASRSAFHRWLVTQANRGDPVGDIAYDTKGDEHFPVAESGFAELIAYLASKTRDYAVLSAFRRAHSEFSKLS